jgi:hypothetical protein
MIDDDLNRLYDELKDHASGDDASSYFGPDAVEKIEQTRKTTLLLSGDEKLIKRDELQRFLSDELPRIYFNAVQRLDPVRKELIALIDQAEVLHLQKDQLLRKADGQSASAEIRYAWSIERDKAANATPPQISREREALCKNVPALSAEVDVLRRQAKVVDIPPPTPQPEPPTLSPTDQLMSILRGGSSPFGSLWSLINDSSVIWDRDERSWIKGYIMACFSELVYLRMSKYELRGKDKYKIIPSMALRFLLEHDIEIDIDQMMPELGDIRAATGESGRIVFGAFPFPKFTIIAVRGTMPWLEDWLIDLDERKIKVGPLGYHAGFYLEAKGALSDLAASVPADKPIYFTGHSLGGALAGILPHLWQGGQCLMTPYTFASPRFGNQMAAELTPVYAYVRSADPGPHVPPRSAGFRSSGWPPTVIPTGDVWLSGWKVLRAPRKALAAHSMEQYRKLMGEECGAPYFPAQIFFNALKRIVVDRIQHP